MLSDRPLSQKLVNLPRAPRASDDCMSRLKVLGHPPCCCYSDKLAQKERQSMGIWTNSLWQSSKCCQKGFQLPHWLWSWIKEGSHECSGQKNCSGLKLRLFLTWLNWRLSATDFKCQALGHLLHLEGRKFLAPGVASVCLPFQLGNEDGYFGIGGSPAEEREQALFQVDMRWDAWRQEVHWGNRKLNIQLRREVAWVQIQTPLSVWWWVNYLLYKILSLFIYKLRIHNSSYTLCLLWRLNNVA